MLRNSKRVESLESRVESRTIRPWRYRRAERQGVLLLVVLSVLVLFMLIGTAFLLSSKHAQTSAKEMAKVGRTGNNPSRLLDRALLQLLRDTESPNSVSRGHSLLRDLYGSDGFEAVASGAVYAGVVPGSAANNLGPTAGQMIDIYVTADTTTTPAVPVAYKLDRDPYGRKVPAQLSTIRGYYNGQLLTITKGPAAGQTAQIVDYQVILNTAGQATSWGFRVMAFPRSDGQALVSLANGFTELLNTTFLVNGRALNGSGAGYNPLAVPGQPRLDALEVLSAGPSTLFGAELALLPNSAYLNLESIGAPKTPAAITNPFQPLTNSDFLALNNFNTGQFGYPNFAGLGDLDEAYDAADMQNAFLAWQSATPRRRGRFVTTGPQRYYDVDAATGQFLRFDLEDLPKPSFHDPALINFWYYRLWSVLKAANIPADKAVVAIVQPFDPATGNPNPNVPSLTVQQAALIASIKRQIMFRPSRDDHPNFDGSNSQTVPNASPLLGFVDQQTGTSITYPFPEIVGPWDVDNNNDGIPDSNWIDLGDPVLETQNGTRYKAVYAVLIEDLDGRLNINAAGGLNDVTPANLDFTLATPAGRGNLAHDLLSPTSVFSSNALSQGSGWGPADISLRSLFPVLNPTDYGNRTEDSNNNGIRDAADATIDNYATLLTGRIKMGTTSGGRAAEVGRYGFINVASPTSSAFVSPGTNYRYQADNTKVTGEVAAPDLLSQIKQFDYPWVVTQLSSFGNAPDLKARFATGLDYRGQPTLEVAADYNPNTPPPPNAASKPNSLLTDSPYELNLSSSQRREPWKLNNESTFAGNLFDQSLVQNDDAPFATADLEKILRAADADSGTIPSRLWDTVGAFDASKLAFDQPQLVFNAAADLFGSSGQPELVAAAQSLASVNRSLVTTDSYSLPVYAFNMPGYVSELGPDGGPGRVGMDDDGQNGTDDISEIGRAGTDDYAAIIGKSVRQSTLLDLFRYRVWLEARKYVMRTNTPNALTDADVAAMNAGTFTAFMTAVNQRALKVIAESPQLESQLLAPDLISGLKMDLNRPFGDGQDNNGNGVVDEPSEAGEPFLDINGNGQRDNNEPFIDVDGDGAYDGPQDQIWKQLTTEKIGVDYLQGNGEPLHPLAPLYNPAKPSLVNVRNLESEGRQRYARHLYCLMLLLMDENYLDTPNVPSLGGDNINQEWFREAVAAALKQENPAATDADINALVMRKLTARRVAQWAINVVDFRDADAVMTPFEYDENPWDGWGCPIPDQNAPTDPTKFTNLPLDGDIATDENRGELIDWSKVASAHARVIAPSPAGTKLDGSASAAVPAIVSPPKVIDQTRGVVWGAERPELLISETMALHDRRTTDESFANNLRIGDAAPPPGDSSGRKPDYDLDQKMKPIGRLFVELINPWSVDGERPAEFYGTPNANIPRGVMLNKLSDAGVGQKRSPVWRMVALRDPINGQLTNQVIDVSKLTAPGSATALQSYATQFLQTDADGFGLNLDVAGERYVYFTSGEDFMTGIGGDPNRADDNAIAGPQGAFDDYQLLGNTYVPTMTNLKVWVPPLPFHLANNPDPGASFNPQPYASGRRYFIARRERAEASAAGAQPNDKDVPIAPILPGRYAVIGPSGIQLNGTLTNPLVAKDGETTRRFVSPLSRFSQLQPANGVQTDSVEHKNTLEFARRVELWPSIDPSINQVMTAENGGPEFFRIGATAVNVTDPPPANNLTAYPDGDPTNVQAADMPIEPAVAIPVEDLNISEPVEGYPSRRYEELYRARNVSTGGTPGFPSKLIDQGAYGRTGEIMYTTPFDHPFDLDFELQDNRTTQNYRSIQLQRLANPALPWNPLPIDAKGNLNPLHQKNLPVNPYMTIDSQSVDLTAYNGASNLERTQLPSSKIDATLSQRLNKGPIFQSDLFAPLPEGSLADAPDHVLQALVYIFKKEGLTGFNTANELRRKLQNDPNQEVETQYLRKIETNRQSPDLANRDELLRTTRTDAYGRDWGGEWGWSLYKRALPDYPAITTAELQAYKQRLNLKSLERGAHDSTYYPKYTANSPEGWWYDTNWEPRLLWKQERPNVMLMLKDAAGNITRATDLVDSKSKVVLSGKDESRDARLSRIGAGQNPTPDPDDDKNRDAAVWKRMKLEHPPAGTGQLDQVVDFVLDQTLGFANSSYAPELDRKSGQDVVAMMTTIAPGAPEVAVFDSNNAPAQIGSLDPKEINTTPKRKALINSQAGLTAADKGKLAVEIEKHRRQLTRATFPWFPWNDRPFMSADELLQVPAGSSSLMLRDYSVINRGTPNPYDGDGRDAMNNLDTPPARIAHQKGMFGQLMNFFLTSPLPATATPNASNSQDLTGAPNYYRLLDYVQVPSRYVGTETVLRPEIFNDVPGVVDTNLPGGVGLEINSPDDPRFLFQPPYNKVSKQRDPGRVNLNTVIGRRAIVPSQVVGGLAPLVWSDVFDGIMHRDHDGPTSTELGHFGPAWRDVALSRRGYAQYDATGKPVDQQIFGTAPDIYAVPDMLTFGLNPNFPTFVANPFRSGDAGDLVPLPNMMHMGVDATFLRRHPYSPGPDGGWGTVGANDTEQQPALAALADKAREAGYGDDVLNADPTRGGRVPSEAEGARIPLLSETLSAPFFSGERNPGMMHQPMTRMENLTTNRSNVFAVWITVGYFEVEKAPDWNTNEKNIQARLGGDGVPGSAATIAAQALYNRIYPEGYTLGKELGSDTGDIHRERGFYIIDRSIEVGFKPGEDLNVEKAILLRRRIE